MAPGAAFRAYLGLRPGRVPAMVNFKRRFENGDRMSRPSEFTRQSIMKAAVELFAEKGFDGASVRAIVARARVNQAAIN